MALNNQNLSFLLWYITDSVLAQGGDAWLWASKGLNQENSLWFLIQTQVQKCAVKCPPPLLLLIQKD